MSVYYVERWKGRKWRILHVPDGQRVGRVISAYPTRQQALTVARLLAGHSSKVQEVKQYALAR